MNKLNVFSKSPKFSNERTFFKNKKLMEKIKMPIAFPKNNEGP